MGVHEDIFFPITLGAVYLNKKLKMGYKKIVVETTSKEKLERRLRVNPYC
jgi:hypothetical protein